MFNAEQFMHTSSDAALSTKRIAVPKGSYPGVISKIEFRENQGKKDPSKSYVFSDITWTLQVPEQVKAETGRDTVTVRQSIIVDVNEQGTGLDFSKGKNISLGRIREAVGQNQGGQPWAPAMLMGAAARVNVEHRIDGEDIYDEVASVVKL